MKARRWARYVSIGPLSVRGLVEIARNCGMKCIAGWKPDMHFYNEIALYGTAEQLARAEAEWRAASETHEDGSVSSGHEVLARKPAAAFGIRIDKPREEWAENFLIDEEFEPMLANDSIGGC